MEPIEVVTWIRARWSGVSPWAPALLLALAPAAPLAAHGSPTPALSDARPTEGELEALLAEDLAWAGRLQELLSRPALTAGELGQALDASVASAELEGATLSLTLQATAGLGRVRVRVIALEGVGAWQVHRATLHLRTDGDGHDPSVVAQRFKDALRATWRVPVEEVENGFVLRWQDETLARLQEASRTSDFHAGLGLPDRGPQPGGMESRSRSPDELDRVHAHLSSPFPSSEAYIGGWESIPIRAYRLRLVVDLARAGRWDLVRSLLRGLDPVVRIYAAWTLQRFDRLEADDREVLATLRRSPVLVQYWTGGCLIHQTTAAALLDLPHPFANVVEEMTWRAEADQAVVEIQERWNDARPRFESGRLLLF